MLMSSKGTLSKWMLYLFSSVGLISVTVALIGAYLFYKQTNLSPTEFINKAASKSGITQENDELLSSQAKYTTRYQYLALNQTYPRILNKEYSVVENPHEYFIRHFDILKERKERLYLNCESVNYYNKLACFLYYGESDYSAFENLKSGLIDFTLDEPKESGYYGNGWSFAFIYDIARAVAKFDSNTVNQIDDRIAVVLEIYLKKLDRESASLWHGRASLASTAFLLASVLDLDKPNNKVLYSRAYGHFLDLMNAVEASGTWPEGYNYWIQNRAHLVVLGLAAMVNHPTSDQKDRAYQLLLNIGYAHIYLTRPDNQIEGYADEGSRIDLKEETRKVIDVIAKVTGDVPILMYSNWLKKLHPRASYFRDYRWMTPYFISPESYVQTSAVLKGPEQHLSDFEGLLPNARLFGKGYANHAVMRSGWGKDDTFISFRASNVFTHHQHYDAGHFTLFKGAPLISNSGTYGAYTSEHRLNYYVRTVAKNSLLIMQEGEHNSIVSSDINDGGQRVIMPTGSSISSYQEWLENITEKGDFYSVNLLDENFAQNDIQSISVDIAPAYNDRSLIGGNTKAEEAIRQLVYLPNEDALIIADSVKAASKDYTVKSLFHTYTKPEVFGKENVLVGTASNGILRSDATQFEVQNKGSRLYADVLLPIKPALQLIGGPNYQYYVDVDGNEDTFDGKNMDEGAKSDSFYELPLWRLELLDAQKNPTYQSLVVLQARVEDEIKKTVQYYMRNPKLASFSVGDTLVLLANDTIDYTITLNHNVKSVVVMMGGRPLKVRMTSKGECKVFENASHTANSQAINFTKGTSVSLFVSAVYNGDNQC